MKGLMLRNGTRHVGVNRKILTLRDMRKRIRPLRLDLRVRPKRGNPLAPPIFITIRRLVRSLLARRKRSRLMNVQRTRYGPSVRLFFIFVRTTQFTTNMATQLLCPTRHFFRLKVGRRIPPLARRFCFVRFVMPSSTKGYGRYFKTTTDHAPPTIPRPTTK